MPINHLPIDESEVKEKSKRGKAVDIKFYETEPKYTFSDIVLSDDIEKKVKRSILFIQNQKLIFDEWNLKSVIKNYNLCINLYGPSGTGKTMTAHAIAKELGKKIVIVNYAEIESKYVGETSKNLLALFKFAQQYDCVILFDEADALLSKRVSVMHSATDVSVNQTRNTLLKILDEYDGIVIFTTNFIQNFDIAFMRRIFCNIEFRLPDYEARVNTWEHYLIKSLPIENREKLIQNISKIEGLSGSDIATIVLKSAVVTLEQGSQSISEELLIEMSEEVKKVRADIQGKYEITTRRVSEEYAKDQLKKGELINGIN